MYVVLPHAILFADEGDVSVMSHLGEQSGYLSFHFAVPAPVSRATPSERTMTAYVSLPGLAVPPV